MVGLVAASGQPISRLDRYWLVGHSMRTRPPSSPPPTTIGAQPVPRTEYAVAPSERSAAISGLALRTRICSSPVNSVQPSASAAAVSARKSVVPELPTSTTSSDACGLPPVPWMRHSASSASASTRAPSASHVWQAALGVGGAQRPAQARDAAPSSMRASPGSKKSCLGQHIRKNRMVRQPSRNVFRCGAWALRPSGCSVMGTSANRTPKSLALMIISVANSMPVQRSSSRWYASFVNPRIPQ